MQNDSGLYKDKLDNCIACGSTETIFWKERYSRGIGFERTGFQLYKCKKCNCIFINPRPSKELLLTIYSRSGHSLREPITLEEVNRQEKDYPNGTIDSEHLVSIAYDLLNKQHPIELSALDIGSGYGFYTEAALRKGFSVTAINPSVWENNIFEQINGFRPIELFFEDVEFDKKFDLVIFSQVLEHIDDPLSFLKRVRSILSDDGVIALAVPNLDSYLVKFGTDGGVFWIPEHLNCFTKKSLNMLLERAGFDVVKFEGVSRFPYFTISDKLKLKGFKRTLCNYATKKSQFLPLKAFDSIGWSGCLNVWAKQKKTNSVQ